MESICNRVLIVEDDLSLKPFWSVIIRRCLQGATLDWAVSCEKAKELLHKAATTQSPYGLIITDIFLAGCDTGLDLLSSPEVKSSNAQKLLVTAADAVAVGQSCNWRDQDVAVLAKPLSVPKCERIIESIFAHKSEKPEQAV